ncbi:MAG: beta-hydroxyacyl-ACP dehydratase [Planctomycetes bacterium]|nr:beta-hydroxyacyl-ACP dehydratase [Planctomycetota bacterium]
MTETLSLQSIPHRPPFLYVDEIVEVSRDRIITTKFVDPQSDFFRGHYPEEPVMPGVLLLECCFQAGALLIAHRIGDGEAARGIPVLTRIRDARFKRIVRPGETLRVEATLEDELDAAYHLRGTATVGDEVAVHVGFSCMLAPQGDSRP